MLASRRQTTLQKTPSHLCPYRQLGQVNSHDNQGHSAIGNADARRHGCGLRSIPRRHDGQILPSRSVSSKSTSLAVSRSLAGGPPAKKTFFRPVSKPLVLAASGLGLWPRSREPIFHRRNVLTNCHALPQSKHLYTFCKLATRFSNVRLPSRENHRQSMGRTAMPPAARISIQKPPIRPKMDNNSPRKTPLTARTGRRH